MSETKTVLLLVPVEVAADGKHCGKCPMVWAPREYHPRVFCSGWGAVEIQDEPSGYVRCPSCLSAEQHPAAAPQPEPEPSRVICPICQGVCRCEEDRR